MRKLNRNLISYSSIRSGSGPSNKHFNYYYFICRGTTIRNRNTLWSNYISSIQEEHNRQIDNSYIGLEEEPDNPHDPNAIIVMCYGEFFGTMGYVGREYTLEIKSILAQCKNYRVDLIDETEVGNKEINLVLTWYK